MFANLVTALLGFGSILGYSSETSLMFALSEATGFISIALIME